MVRRYLLILSVAAAVLAGGCGADDSGGSSSSPQTETPQEAYARLKQANVLKGDAICTKLKQELEPLREPPASSAAAAKLVPAAVAAYRRAEERFKQQIADLPDRDFDPRAGVALFGYMAGFADQIVTLNNYGRAVRDDDEDVLRGSIQQFPEAVATQQDRAREYGFKVCSNLDLAQVTLPS